MRLRINDELHEVPAEWRDESLLSVLRDLAGLTGTKFGCGRGACGACTVHLDGRAARACIVPVAAVGKAAVTTIEGLADPADGDALHPVQRAWIEGSVPQCGYCQPGQMMTAVAFLAGNAAPSPAEVRAAMDANLCRCGTYERIRRAVLRAADIAAGIDERGD